MTSVTSNQSVVTNNIKNSFNNNDSNTMPNVSYRFDFERFCEHLVDVSLSFTATIDAPQLWLPAWIPGSYLMREFARNITAVHYEVLDSQIVGDNKKSERHRGQKIDKHTWALPHIKTGQTVVVHYEVYCYDLSVRTAYVDQQRLYGNFTSLALAVSGQEDTAVTVSLIVPATFFAD
ncbi:MAG: M61 family metallopeptidase, partial [Psychrobacter sp.]